MWAWIGAATAALGGSLAVRNARRRGGSYYDAEVYGMTARSHVRFALLSGAFLAIFIVSAFVPALEAVPILAIYTLLLVLYASSFARGFPDP
jgi:hypothetical protein